MIEEQGLEDGLKKIDQVVVTPDVSELVHEQHVELKRCQASDEACGYDNDRTYGADHKRDIDRLSPSLSQSFSTRMTSARDASLVDWRVILRVLANPPMSLTDDMMSPSIQAMTSQGRAVST